MLTMTASIGQGTLRSALRLHKNYIKYEKQISVNREISGCSSCAHHCDSNACSDCLSKVVETKIVKKYINEKNRYGTKSALSRNDILLFMYLHFLNPNQHGFIRLFDAEEAADYLHCHVRTIKNALRRMSDAAYITYQKIPGIPYHFHIFIKEYSNYFAKADNNGRGYVRISKELFDVFVLNKTITSLRLSVRSFLYTLDESRSSQLSVVPRTYKELKRDLPDYCHKKQIRAAVNTDSFREVFDVNDKKYTINVLLKSKYDISHILSSAKQEFEQLLNADIKTYNKQSDKKHQIVLAQEDYNDILNIVQKYPSSIILTAFDEVVKTFIEPGIPIHKIGALVRAFAKRRVASFA